MDRTLIYDVPAYLTTSGGSGSPAIPQQTGICYIPDPPIDIRARAYFLTPIE